MAKTIFSTPSLTTFCRLEDLDLTCIDQHITTNKAVLKYRPNIANDWRHKRGGHADYRDTVLRRLAHSPSDTAHHTSHPSTSIQALRVLTRVAPRNHGRSRCPGENLSYRLVSGVACSRRRSGHHVSARGEARSALAYREFGDPGRRTEAAHQRRDPLRHRVIGRSLCARVAPHRARRQIRRRPLRTHPDQPEHRSETSVKYDYWSVETGVQTVVKRAPAELAGRYRGCRAPGIRRTQPLYASNYAVCS